MFASPLPGDGDLSAFHRQQYAGGNTPSRLQAMRPEWAEERQYRAKYQEWARTWLAERAAARRGAAAATVPCRMLEIGCAAGGMLLAARDLGMAAVGVEVSAEAARFGRATHGLDIRVGELADLGLPAAAFGLVVLYDLIEHVQSPSALLQECRRLTVPGGVMAIHTVNVDSATAERAGSDFYLADTGGGHATLFTAEHLSAFLRKAGFVPYSVHTHGYRIVQSEADRARMGWRRRFVRLAENLGNAQVKRRGRGHFLALDARAGAYNPEEL
ncbi:MAG TPA: class I SAM-dependent methyltransferase [Planctomycetota bacterium]